MDLQSQNEFLVIFTVIGLAFLAFMAYLYYCNNKRILKTADNSSKIIFGGILVIAFIIRFALAYEMPGYVSDSNCFVAWARLSFEGGLGNFYSGEFFADYPPLYIYVLYFLGFLQNALTVPPEFTNAFIRMPAILLDIACAIFIYNIATKKFKNYIPLFLGALIAFNPAIIINSAIWGQVDIVLTLALVLTLYMLLKDKLLFAGIFFVLAFLLKPQAVIIGPVVLFYVIKYIADSKNKLKSILTFVIALGVMLGLFILLSMPFKNSTEPFWLIDRYINTVSFSKLASLNTFNLFSMLGQNFMPDTNTILGIPIFTLGIILAVCVCGYAFWLFIKNKSKHMIFTLAAFVTMGIVAVAPRMHERYIFAAPIFLLIAYILCKDKRLILSAVLLFGVAFVNQVVALYHYEQFIDTQLMVTLSAVSMATFVYVGYLITQNALKQPQLIQEKGIKESSDPPINYPKQRLETFEEKKYIHKKDWLIMLIIAGVYSIFAFTNLGSFDVPKSGVKLTQPALIEFETPVDISKMRYYADYGDGIMDIEYSKDGVNYERYVSEEDGGSVNHQKHQLYQWLTVPITTNAQYFRIIPKSEYINLLEWSFIDAKGEVITPKTTNTPELFDEQAFAPKETTYMTEFYFDEIYHVRTAYENIHGIEPYEISHPPLGKILLSLGIQLFGMNGFGWRFMGTLTGVLMLFVIYIFAKLFLKQTKYATFATILFAVDFMHFTQTRIGTIDSYSILFIMLMYLFMFMYSKTNFNMQKLSKTLIPLFLCGLFFGIGAATKWLCIYSGPGLLLIFVMIMHKRYKEYKYAQTDEKYSSIAKNYKSNLIKTLLWCVLFFLGIPAIIYLLSYIPYTTVTQGNAYTFTNIIENQKYMLNYHAYLNPDVVHPFASKWYTWPLTIRPILYYHQIYADGTISNITSMGNPLIWWTGLISMFAVAVLAIKKKVKGFSLLIIAIAMLNQFVPWTLISRELFIYHYFATVPFMIILLVYWLKYLEKFKYGKIFGIAFVCACIVMFAVFYPIASGVRVSEDYLNGIRWLESWPFY